MAQEKFNDLIWFLAVAQERSFTRAAAKLGIAQSTLSHTIKRLEERMGFRLLTRTTRSVGLTEAGKRLHEAMAPRIQEIEQEIAALMAFRDKPAGTIRITLSDHAFDQYVWPRLEPVLESYPDIVLELNIDNGLRNIIEDGFDAGIRLAETVEQDMIAVRISPDWRLVAVASPEFLAANRVPLHPQELIGLNCINRRMASSGGLYMWEFEKGGEALRVRTEGQLILNTSAGMVDAAVRGHGIAFVPESDVLADIAAGSLVQVLDDWSPFFAGYFIYYPSRRQNLPALKLIVDTLRHSQG